MPSQTYMVVLNAQQQTNKQKNKSQILISPSLPHPLPLFPSFMAKRPFNQMSTSLTFPSPSPSYVDPTKRSKPHTHTLPIPPGHVAFRLLIHVSSVSAFIGKSGAPIKQLQLDSRSKIRVEDSLEPGSDHRVILIVSSPGPTALDAAGRVFDRVLEVSKEVNNEKEKSDGRDLVRVLVLVDSDQAGSVIGKRGIIVEKLKRESGAKIRVLDPDQSPVGVSLPSQLVEIEGSELAVKKALLGVCGRLQEVAQTQGAKSSTREYSSLEYVDPPLQRTPVSVASTSSPVVGKPLFEADRLMISDRSLQKQELVFRILCSNDRVGGVIGRGGSIVRALQDETGAAITVGQNISGSEERVITVTSQEDVESSYSPAQRAVILVFVRSCEAAVEKGLEPSLNKGSSVSARLVVPSKQAGCLLGKGGVIVSQMRMETGTSISIVRDERVQKCASEDDAIVEITGQYSNVQDALYRVTSKLRDNLFASKVVTIPGSRHNSSIISDSVFERIRDPISVRGSSVSSLYIDRQATRTGLDSFLHPDRLDTSPSPGVWTSELADGINLRTCTSIGNRLISKNGIELGSPKRSAIITNTKVEILVPGNALSSVYGENGNNLARIRQISGANVVVQEARPGSRDRTVIISGTPDETQAAQSLLHAFILTGP